MIKVNNSHGADEVGMATRGASLESIKYRSGKLPLL